MIKPNPLNCRFLNNKKNKNEKEHNRAPGVFGGCSDNSNDGGNPFNDDTKRVLR